MHACTSGVCMGKRKRKCMSTCMRSATPCMQTGAKFGTCANWHAGMEDRTVRAWMQPTTPSSMCPRHAAPLLLSSTSPAALKRKVFLERMHQECDVATRHGATRWAPPARETSCTGPTNGSTSSAAVSSCASSGAAAGACCPCPCPSTSPRLLGGGAAASPSVVAGRHGGSCSWRTGSRPSSFRSLDCFPKPLAARQG